MASDFARTIKGIANNEILIPAAHTALFDPEFKGFVIDMEGWKEDLRVYDGWFHPSTQATWTVRQLYVYLVAHQLLDQERLTLDSILAITQGKFWHKFFQRVWLDQGTLIKDEVPVLDEDTNRRGHADGFLFTGEGLEIKTINEHQVSKIVSEDILREKKPQYWGQTQDYLDILGLKSMRYFMINPSYPFPKTEFVVQANKSYQDKRRVEYKQAIELATKFPDVTAMQSSTFPAPVCCAPRSKESKACPARYACPIGQMR
jgi:hypothetical protein